MATISNISVHRALTQLKTTSSRIMDMMEPNLYLSYKMGKNEITPSGQAVKDVSKNILAAWDKVNALINNYANLKNAITRSNAGISKDSTNIKRVKYKDKYYTVSEVINMNYENGASYIQFMKNLHGTLLSAHKKMLHTLEVRNEEVERKVEQYLNTVSGGDKNKLSSTEIENISNMFYENNKYVLIDPLGIENKIKQLSDDIANFEEWIDATLSEENALTVITVELSDIE